MNASTNSTAEVRKTATARPTWLELTLRLRLDATGAPPRGWLGRPRRSSRAGRAHERGPRQAGLGALALLRAARGQRDGLVVPSRRLSRLDPGDPEGEAAGEVKDADRVAPPAPAEQAERETSTDQRLRGGQPPARRALGQCVSHAPEAALVQRGQRELGQDRGSLQAGERDAGGMVLGLAGRRQRQPRCGGARGRRGRDEDRPEEDAAAGPHGNGGGCKEDPGIGAEVAAQRAR